MNCYILTIKQLLYDSYTSVDFKQAITRHIDHRISANGPSHFGVHHFSLALPLHFGVPIIPQSPTYIFKFTLLFVYCRDHQHKNCCSIKI